MWLDSVESYTFRKCLSGFAVKDNWLTYTKIPTRYEGIIKDWMLSSPMAGDHLQVRGYGLSHLVNFALGILGGEGDSSDLSEDGHTSSPLVVSHLDSQKHQ